MPSADRMENYKRAKLFSWRRSLDFIPNTHAWRKLNTAEQLDWNQYRSTLDILVDAGYCLDRLM